MKYCEGEESIGRISVQLPTWPFCCSFIFVTLVTSLCMVHHYLQSPLCNSLVLTMVDCHILSRVCVLTHSVMFTSLQPRDCSPPGSSVHGIFSGKNTGVSCHFLLQGTLPTHGLNPSLLLGRWILYHWATNLGYNVGLPNCLMYSD